MRELRFRVWNPDEERMMYFTMSNIWFPDRYLTQHRYHVQQFTGLHDWTAREIYEGDLVKFSEEDSPFEVKYCVDSEGAYFGLIDSENSDTGYALSTDKDLEVVGNIFENEIQQTTL
jgi:hypothetical protein